MILQFNKHRCFVIPKRKLDLFFVKLQMESESLIRFETDWVFVRDEGSYDVVVAYYGGYPYVENEIEKFVEQLQKEEK